MPLHVTLGLVPNVVAPLAGARGGAAGVVPFRDNSQTLEKRVSHLDILATFAAVRQTK